MLVTIERTKMPGKPEVPVDHLTHFPLPLAPDINLPAMPEFDAPEYLTYDRAITNFHHPLFRRRELEDMGDGGAAARDARVQWTWTEWHDRLHEEWGGLDQHLPRIPKAQCRTALLGLMDYVPRQVIDCSRPTPRIVTTSRWQRDILRAQIRVGRNGERIRRFLLDYSVEFGGPQVDPGTIDTFLWLAKKPNTRPRRLWELAGVILNQSIDPLLTPSLHEIYAYTKNRGLVRPGLPRALGSLMRREIVSAFPDPPSVIRAVAHRFELLREPIVAT